MYLFIYFAHFDLVTTAMNHAFYLVIGLQVVLFIIGSIWLDKNIF